MRRLTTAFVITLLLLALLLPAVFAQDASVVEVSDQDLTDAGALTIDRAVVDGASWVVIHENACTDDQGNNTFGDVVGHAALEAGENTNVDVTLDEGVQVTDGDALCAMLHTDDSEQGTYEFGEVEGADAPITSDGEIVMTTFTVGGEMAAQEATATPTTEVTEEMTPTATATTEAVEEMTPTATTEAMTATATAEAPGTLPETGGDAGTGTTSGLLLAIAALMVLLGGGMVMFHLASRRA